MVKDSEAWHAAVHGVAKSFRHDWATEQPPKCDTEIRLNKWWCKNGMIKKKKWHGRCASRRAAAHFQFVKKKAASVKPNRA